jgi:predicted lipoprotein with Yx(FWY)xxD motif
VVEAAHNPTYGTILVTTSGLSLYLLTSEANGRFTCTSAACTTFWPPLTVPPGTTSVRGGPGVDGRLGVIKRPDGSLQVTDNGYPLYRYSGDHAAGETNGEGISSFGGTWYLVRASATTGAGSAVTGPSSG